MARRRTIIRKGCALTLGLDSLENIPDEAAVLVMPRVRRRLAGTALLERALPHRGFSRDTTRQILSFLAQANASAAIIAVRAERLLVLRLGCEGERRIPAGMAAEAVAAAPRAAAALCLGSFSKEVCHAPRVASAAAEERPAPLNGWAAPQGQVTGSLKVIFTGRMRVPS